MPPASESEIAQAHEVYREITGMPINLTMERIRQWELVLHRFSMDDVRIYLKAKKRFAKENKKPFMLQFSFLFRNLDEMEENIAALKADLRKPRFDPGKARVLAQSGRAAEPKSSPERNVAQIMGYSNDPEKFKKGLEEMKKAAGL